MPSLRVKNRLDGATNFKSWKTKILVFEVNDIQYYVKEIVPELADAKEKAKHKNNEENAKRILIDSIKYQLISHVANLKTTKEMYDSLVGLFESKNTSRKLALRHQLHCIMMSR